MSFVIKSDDSDAGSVQQLINKFKRETMDDPVLEKAKEREMIGYQKPSASKNVKKREWRKEKARLRRKSKRRRGLLK